MLRTILISMFSLSTSFSIAQQFGGSTMIGLSNYNTFLGSNSNSPSPGLYLGLRGLAEWRLTNSNGFVAEVGLSKKGYVFRVSKFPNTETNLARTVFYDTSLSFLWKHQLFDRKRHSFYSKVGLFGALTFNESWHFTKEQLGINIEWNKPFDLGIITSFGYCKTSKNKPKMFWELELRKSLTNSSQDIRFDRYFTSLGIVWGFCFSNKRKKRK